MAKEQKLINLRKKFGDKYKVSLDDSGTSFTDLSCQIIKCKNGHIYAHSGNLLGFASDKPIRKNSVSGKVADLPFITVTQDGSDGANLLFDEIHLDTVAALVKPRMRRFLTEEQKSSRSANLAKFREANPGWKPGKSIGQTT